MGTEEGELRNLPETEYKFGYLGRRVGMPSRAVGSPYAS